LSKGFIGRRHLTGLLSWASGMQVQIFGV